MLTENQMTIINTYVNDEYYDTEKLIKYLNLHRVVGNEIFDYVDRKNRNFNRKEAHDLSLDDEEGYIPVDIETFVRRIPFYFYTWDGALNTHRETIGDVLLSKWHEIKTGEMSLDEIYEALEYLFYEKGISLYDIFNYNTEQTGLVTEEYFFQWVEYIHLCEHLGWDDIMPDNFIVAYNLAREELGLEPIIFIPNWDMHMEKPYQRYNAVLEFEGVFPCDEHGNPIMRWIGLKVINAGKIMGGSVKAQNGYLKIEIKPDTVVYYKDVFNNGEEFWNQVYAGPLTMNFDYKVLKTRREAMGYSQMTVAKAVDTNLRTYQKWEYGETQPNCYYLLRLMNWLDISDIQDTILFDIPKE